MSFISTARVADRPGDDYLSHRHGFGRVRRARGSVPRPQARGFTCSCTPPPPLPATAVRDLFQLESIQAVADIVWQAMKECPATYSLTPEACAAFEQSVQTSQIFIEFRESTPGTVFEYLPGTPNAPPQDESHDSPPNSYTCLLYTSPSPRDRG